MIRACIIGVSGYGQTHYDHLMREVEKERMLVLGATIINQEEEADKCSRLRNLGCELFTDYHRMLERFAGDCDLCFIPTGTPLHAPMTIAALRSGANVYVEKPLAGSIQEAHAIQATEAQTKRFVAVGYQSMYAQECLAMKRALCEERMGRVLAIKYWGLWPRLDSYYQRNAWAGRLRHHNAWVLDSPINNALAHQLNMICFLAGGGEYDAACLVSAQAELYRAHAIESADTACLRLKTENGPDLYAFVTHCSRAQAGPEIVARCEHGVLRWIPGQAHLEHADGRLENIACDDNEGMRKRMIHSIRERVRDDRIFVCEPAVAKTQVLAVNGAHESTAVHEMPADLIERLPREGSTKTVVRGLDEIIHRAFAAEKLFSELGDVPWARAGEVFDLQDYFAFTGGKRGA